MLPGIIPSRHTLLQKKPLTALTFLAANPAFTDDAKKGRQSK
jgi:hypothetical protein